MITCDFASPPVTFQCIFWITSAPEGTSHVYTVLTAKAWTITFIYIFTGLGIVGKLVS